MSKPPRIPRSTADVEAELRDQLQLLRLSCEHYDRGIEAAGKHIALSLRVLLHIRGQSRALLDQLHLLGLAFLDTAGPLNPHNALSEMPMLISFVSGAGVKYLAALENAPFAPRRRAFSQWWNDPVLRDQTRQLFSRKQIVLHIADTDGGAHVDADLDEAYMKLSRENSLGWWFRKDGADMPPQNAPHLASARQIAHEVLRTLHSANNKFSELAEPLWKPLH